MNRARSLGNFPQVGLIVQISNFLFTCESVTATRTAVMERAIEIRS